MSPTGSARCPCGSGRADDACCRRFHAGASAPTAVDLMRSRYTAFVVRDADYLLATWDPAHRPRHVTFDPDQEWLGLEILSSSGGTMFDDEATVTFAATFAVGGSARRLLERSRFRRVDGRWLYVDAAEADVSDL